MIELKSNRLFFSFPKISDQANIFIEFQRTLRIPDDDKNYPLPPGLGPFHLCHVDDYASNVPESWIRHGGVMLPMYQSEALWLNFTGHWDSERQTHYPFVIKIAAGKINAVTGEEWDDGISEDPQNYLVSPLQPWLDGYCVEKGFIRQFVAMPLGAGYSAEEQITGKGEFGGLQVEVYPMKREVFERRFPKIPEDELKRSRRMHGEGDLEMDYLAEEMAPCAASAEMGLGAGGRMVQEIYEDPYDINDWDLECGSRCFVHIANSMVWHEITGKQPPSPPPTAKTYTNSGLPWFDYYDDGATAVQGSKILGKLKSVLELGKEKREVPLPENKSVAPEKIVEIRKGLKKGQVREGNF